MASNEDEARDTPLGTVAVVDNLGKGMESILGELEELIAENPLEATIDRFKEQQRIANQLIELSNQEDAFALKRISNLLARIGCFEYSVSRKLVETLSQIIRARFQEGLESKDESERDTTERVVNLLVARGLLRAKLSILEATRPFWARLIKLVEHYENSTQELDFIIGVAFKRSRGGALGLDHELQVQADTWDELSKVNGYGEPSDESKTLTELDEILDEAFELDHSSAESVDATLSPLVEASRVSEWFQELMDPEIRETLEESDRVALDRVREPKDDGEQSLASMSIEMIEEARTSYLVNLGRQTSSSSDSLEGLEDTGIDVETITRKRKVEL